VADSLFPDGVVINSNPEASNRGPSWHIFVLRIPFMNTRLDAPLAVTSETITCRMNFRTRSSTSRGHLTIKSHLTIWMLIPVLIAVIEFKWIPPGPLMFACGKFDGNSILKLTDAVGFCSNVCFQFSGSSRSWDFGLGCEFFISLRVRRMPRYCRSMAVL